ncbi:deoxyribose-phosphate aldolase [Cloacibacillus sp. An23]|uniref:deoxyribose-phosphate aldolase n=1 Tax=Cloacibacillus sp. An23 TaxID=1965591 RepID=UPI000B386177|nr:deoxyribose-phosphate aldolase [Cloacibacillus sp. An23]OUO90534.1 deoxyribose-phosphate aldolase [Cloacibacillus sp. An23]
MNLAKYIDHTNLNPAATAADIKKLCEEARAYGFASVCVNSSRVKLAAYMLKDSGVAVCSVVGFPLGAMSAEAKAFEARCAANDGASEIDMVINVGLLKDGGLKAVEDDIRAVVQAVPEAAVKVIIETCLLTDEEKIAACRAAEAAGAKFVKTSTGFSTGGATEHDVRLMRKAVSPAVKVKASGGIRDAETAKKMIEAGAERIGASKSIAICEGAE